MRTILIVDDEPDILLLLRILLQEEYEVITAEGGQQALTILETRQAELVLSDQKMPGMSGVELLRQVRDIQPQAIRILMTAFTELQTVIDAINIAGVYKYVQKPWDPDQLVSLIHGCFAWGGQEET